MGMKIKTIWQGGGKNEPSDSWSKYAVESAGGAAGCEKWCSVTHADFSLFLKPVAIILKMFFISGLKILLNTFKSKKKKKNQCPKANLNIARAQTASPFKYIFCGPINWTRRLAAGKQQHLTLTCCVYKPMKAKLIDAAVFHNGEQIRIWQQRGEAGYFQWQITRAWH